MIESVRRDYFLNVQDGRPSSTLLDPETLPAKDATVDGIAWLPRLAAKAYAKLRGELPASLMYACGGDRAFLENYDLDPAEFLTALWRCGGIPPPSPRGSGSGQTPRAVDGCRGRGRF
ncbi:MAG: hypothetical protein FJ382_07915 [Verrucomicrobia bacterium]|nr:hypothetical protein [Verrucomicrobiota bacterium]